MNWSTMASASEIFRAKQRMLSAHPSTEVLPSSGALMTRSRRLCPSSARMVRTTRLKHQATQFLLGEYIRAILNSDFVGMPEQAALA